MLSTRKELDDRLRGAARAWLDEALAEAAHAATHPDPSPDAGASPAPDTPPTPPAGPHTYAVPPWELRFAAAGRHCGLEHADSVRSLLLIEARADLPTVTRLYEQGSAAERRAVLLTLDRLHLGATALPLVEDALRTNDTRLVAAAVGPYAAAHLETHSWRHAVLKCLFTGVPVEAVAKLGNRARGDAELARMLGDFSAERTAAGRTVPADLHTVLDLTAPAAPTQSVSAAPTEEES